MNEISVLIVDDEFLARESLRHLLSEIDLIGSIAEADGPAAALEMLAAHPVDLMFLDVSMPECSGLDFLKTHQIGIPVIFVTAYDQYALKAFELHAVDYLLKPLEPARVREAVCHVCARFLRTAAPNKETKQPAPPAEQLVEFGSSKYFVNHREILAVEADGNYTNVFLSSGEVQCVRQTLTQWSEVLPTGEFLKLNRKLIIQTSRIYRLDLKSHAASFHLENSKFSFEVGRSAAQVLRQHFTETNLI